MLFDVACFHAPAKPGDPAVQRIADAAGGTLIVGSAKLAQRVAIELLTEQGSQKYNNRGTLFLTRLRFGAYTEMDVLAAFAAARNGLRANLQGEELPTDDPLERYVDSTIDQVIVTPAAVQLRLNIRSRAGLTTVILLPALVFGFED